TSPSAADRPSRSPLPSRWDSPRPHLGRDRTGAIPWKKTLGAQFHRGISSTVESVPPWNPACPDAARFTVECAVRAAPWAGSTVEGSALRPVPRRQEAPCARFHGGPQGLRWGGSTAAGGALRPVPRRQEAPCARFHGGKRRPAPDSTAAGGALRPVPR